MEENNRTAAENAAAENAAAGEMTAAENAAAGNAAEEEKKAARQDAVKKLREQSGEEERMANIELDEKIDREMKGKRKKKGCLRTFLIAIVCVLALGGSFLLGRFSLTAGSGHGTGVDNSSVLNKLSLLEMCVGTYYLNDTDSDELESSIYKGFISGLGDKYAEYYTAEEYRQLMDEDSGEYEGIGISIAKDTDTGYAEVVSVFKGQPAYEAGIEVGDMIMKVNDKETADMELNEVVSEIKNKDRDDAVLTVYRDGKTKEYTVKKSSVKIETVTYKMKDNKTGYIQVSQFLENTGDQFSDAVDDLEKQGMKSLIIDLRDNGGGLLTACIDMVSRIIPKDKLIVYTQDKNGEKTEYNSESDKTVDVPIVILTNGNTASASEIMTGCLKDYGKAEVVGETTYGKGIVQNIMGLPDGSAVKFTVSKYYTPKGNDIHEKGITPDVTVKMTDAQKKKALKSEEADTQLQKAMEILNGSEK